MQLTSKDFKHLQFNIFDIPPKANVLSKFPDLAKYPEFTLPFLDEEGKEDATKEHLRNPIIRYALFLYQKHTPLIREKDLNLRKLLALQLAGFQSEDGKYPAEVINIKENRNDIANRIIDRIVRLQKDMDYSTWNTMLENYYNTLSIIRDNTVYNKKDGEMKETKTRQELSDKLPALSEKIQTLADKLFNGDRQFMYVADDINQSIHKFLSPEYIAHHGLPPEPENPAQNKELEEIIEQPEDK